MKRNSFILFMSSLITLFLFLIAGNLISVKQPGLTFVNINSINFSRASGDKSEIKNNSPVKQPINSQKTESKNNLNSSYSHSTKPLLPNFIIIRMRKLQIRKHYYHLKEIISHFLN